MKRVFVFLLPMNSKLWRAWITGYFLDVPFFSFFEKLFFDRLMVPEASDLVFAIGAFGTLLFLGTALIGTPLLASHKGRRWWLWLIFTPFGGYAALFAVAFAERPNPSISSMSQDEKYTPALNEDALRAHQSRR